MAGTPHTSLHAPQTRPVRALLLVDGSQALPEHSHLIHGAQGGSLAAYGLHEQMRRFVSTQCGEATTTSVMLFLDSDQLSRMLQVPSSILASFAQGFSSTSSPSACINVLQGSILATMTGHLSWLLPQVDLVFLAGFSTDMHTHWLTRMRLDSPKLVLVVGQGCAASMKKLVKKRTRFSGLSEVDPSANVRDITHSPSDSEEDERPATPVSAVSLQPKRSLFTRSASPKLFAQPVRPVSSFATPTSFDALANVPTSPVRTTQSSPEHGWAEAAPEKYRSAASWGAQEQDRTVSLGTTQAGSPLGEDQDTSGALAAPTAVVPPVLASVEPVVEAETSSSPASSRRGSVAASTAASASAAPSAPSKTPSLPLVRPPPVPVQYLPLLQIVASLEKSLSTAHPPGLSSSSPPPSTGTAAPSAPLWSAVGTELSKSPHAGKYGKLRTYLLAAQRDGWVSTGKGDNEGSEWIRVSQRGWRALKKGGAKVGK
ncbi:hypothetical protein JCM10207_006576 [Rhodosporidiobolus poonsookiae]